MTTRVTIIIIIAFAANFLVASPELRQALAQSGPNNMISLPIKTVSADTIQLLYNNGRIFTFKLTPETTYCKGDKRAVDWTYLKSKIGSHNSVTLKLSQDRKTALVVWDQGPSMVMSPNSPVSGTMRYDFPDLCK